MDHRGRNNFENCPPAGTGIKISFPSVMILKRMGRKFYCPHRNYYNLNSDRFKNVIVSVTFAK